MPRRETPEEKTVSISNATLSWQTGISQWRYTNFHTVFAAYEATKLIFNTYILNETDFKEKDTRQSQNKKTRETAKGHSMVYAEPTR
eukprot:1473915-Rhodomonas_salina.2